MRERWLEGEGRRERAGEWREGIWRTRRGEEKACLVDLQWKLKDNR